MNHKLSVFLLVILAMTGCTSHQSHYAGTAKKMTQRNFRISSANAYSNLFLDSSAMEKFIAAQHLSDTIANDMRSFYNARNFEFAWFAADGFNEQALAFNSLYNYDEGKSHRKLDKKMDELMTEDDLSPSAGDPEIVKTELLLTWRFINYAWATYPDAQVRAVILKSSVPAIKQSSLDLAENILKGHSGSASNAFYDKLKAQLNIYVDSLKAHEARGFSPRSKDSLNGRIRQLVVNMERMRWMPVLPDGRLILVNIPSFKLQVFNKGAKDFDMDIVVGKEGHNTVLFYGELNQIVFSPYWNLPASIVRKEIIPSIEKNKDYLKEKNMEITGEENGLPVIRQLPGGENELGKVKFLFPNSFNIYFHDTPHKELFKKDNRAYSHGCIRLSDPIKLARYLLQDQPQWTPEKIDSAMNRDTEQYVKVKHPVPVLIYYYTAWVDEHGTLQYAPDIYHHDDKMAKKLFTDY